MCPVLQVGTEEGQSKITTTTLAFEASQKSAMVDCVEAVLRSRRVRIEIEPESEAVRRSFRTRRTAVLVLCFG